MLHTMFKGRFKAGSVQIKDSLLFIMTSHVAQSEKGKAAHINHGEGEWMVEQFGLSLADFI